MRISEGRTTIITGLQLVDAVRALSTYYLPEELYPFLDVVVVMSSQQLSSCHDLEETDRSPLCIKASCQPPELLCHLCFPFI